MKVTKELWNERMKNLQERRIITQQPRVINKISDYKSHLSKIEVGNRVLDIGCGSMEIKKHLGPNNTYIGIDAFPVSNEVYKMEVENLSFGNNTFDTVIVFAMLDNVHDLKKAISEIKRVCNKNIYLLTGINIVPDKYHTVEIKEDFLVEEMKPFKLGYREQLEEKVILIEFVK